jgi:hypothetical protein
LRRGEQDREREREMTKDEGSRVTTVVQLQQWAFDWPFPGRNNKLGAKTKIGPEGELRN